MKKIMNRLYFVLIVIICMMFVFLGYLGVVDNHTIYESRNQDDYVEIQEYTYTEHHREEAPVGIVREYRWTFDETIHDGSELSFSVKHHYIEVYIDGELVYELGPSDQNTTTKTLGEHWAYIPLYTDDIGKEIQIYVTPVYENVADDAIVFNIGKASFVYQDMIYKESGKIFLSMTAFFLGIGFLFLAMVNHENIKSMQELLSIGFLIMLTGIWAFTDSMFASFQFSEKSTLVYYLSLASLMLLPIPLNQYIKTQSKGKLLVACNLMQMVNVSICLVELFLQIFLRIDMREVLFLSHGMLVANGVLFVIAKITHREKGDFFIVCVLGIFADLILYYTQVSSGLLICTVASFLIYFAARGIQTFLKFRNQEKEIEEGRIDIMLSQIRPHFIYNTLGTIHYLCQTQPEKAAEVVQDFSQYLRASFGELEQRSLIPLSKEMDHVKHYTNIEKVRFPDIEIQYDLAEVEFYVPALTIQPLVENAIKHGLMGLESGGKVTIKAWETEAECMVSVEDDGIGFDGEPPIKDDGRRHIGISNIRGRIEAMCGGFLEIESAAGKGTKAVIRIPKIRE